MKLIIGDKNYSSWSMRPWVMMKQMGLVFDEVLVPLGKPETKASILEHSPSGKVPCLITGDGESVWESLAILETLAERYPQQGVWPSDAAARAHARAISSEMHAGFGELRNNMPMNVCARQPGEGSTPGALADVTRIDAIWTECLARYGGPFLFGKAFCAADAMYAPVVSRFITYAPPLSDAARAYVERVSAVPAVREWFDGAHREVNRCGNRDDA
jgi:glutathione S-transferase